MRRVGLAAAGSLAFAVSLLGSRPAFAQSLGPAFPVSPYGEPVPTPGSPIPFDLPPLENPPPFNAPLPPSVPLPPYIRMVPATPPPFDAPLPSSVPRPPLLNLLPLNPPSPVPAPFILPERADSAAQAPAGALRQSLDEYDRRAGLGSGGAVISAARNVAMGAIATGSATLDVVADPSGVIRTARVVDADRNRERWDEFAEELRSVRAEGIRTPELAHGVIMRLHVTARNELTTGQRRWWSPGVFLTFDGADLSAHKERVVHARVISEVWF